LEADLAGRVLEVAFTTGRVLEADLPGRVLLTEIGRVLLFWSFLFAALISKTKLKKKQTK
jgi:hypothetical protein